MMKQTQRIDGDPANTPKLIAAWVFVGIPFVWGVYVTAGNALALFK